jgi:hypothetical protein
LAFAFSMSTTNLPVPAVMSITICPALIGI